MSDEYRIVFTVVGVLILAAAVAMAWHRRGDGIFTLRLGDGELVVSGFGIAMAAVGLATMIVPWVLPDSLTVLAASDHPISAYQICEAPSGSFVVADHLPAGPLNVRIGAGTQYQEVNALSSGTAGLRFDECVQRHDGNTPWWRLEDSGWLFSRYVE